MRSRRRSEASICSSRAAFSDATEVRYAAILKADFFIFLSLDTIFLYLDTFKLLSNNSTLDNNPQRAAQSERCMSMHIGSLKAA
jgi:hypothetical protein